MSPGKVTDVSFTTFSNIVDGKPRGAKEYYQGINPATREKLWDVPIATQQDVDDAVASASKAFQTWRNVPLEEKREYFQRFSDLYKTHMDDMTEVLHLETGKPVSAINPLSPLCPC